MKFKGIEVTGKFGVREYDGYFEIWQNDKKIYWESTNGDDYWAKREYDNKGIEIYFENSNGDIIDERHKTKTKKVFRLYKFLEDKGLTSGRKSESILLGWPQESEGKTQEEVNFSLHYNWLVEEEIK